MNRHTTLRGRAAVYLAALVVFSPGARALDSRTCRLEAESLPATFAECSTLTVPENPDDAGGASIDLFVARIPSLSATPAPDPLVLINGGPGGSSVDLYLQLRGAFEPIRRDRDIVLMDQRGTGRSLAGLECDLPDNAELETADPGVLTATVEACLADFDRDPRYFTTSVAVTDLERLREALGVEQWDVYGVSYGTRVAQHYLRRYPDRVRAMILDGVVPAEHVLGPEIATNAQRALDAIFARCAGQPRCDARFADLPAKFAALERRVAAEGDDAPPVGADGLNSVIRLMSYSAATAALLPLIVDEAQSGNFGPLAGQAEIVVKGLSASISFAMHNAVICTEDAPFFDDAPPLEGHPYLGTAILDALTEVCAVWPAGVIDPGFKQAVVSDRPVLLLSGELDPITPPEYAEAVIAGGLSNARHLIAPGQGHGVAAVGCAPELMRGFLQSADPAAVAGGCLAAEPPPPFFLSPDGPAP